MELVVEKQDLSIIDRLSKAKFKLWLRFRFFAYLIEHMMYIEDNSISTLCVDRYGRCYYNPEFLKTLTEPELMGVLCHEVLHLALKHPERGTGRNIIVNGMSLWNVAIDIVVNYTVLSNKTDGTTLSLPSTVIIPDLEDEGSIEIFGCTIDHINKRSSEEIYDMLKTQMKENGAKELNQPQPRQSGKDDQESESDEDSEQDSGTGNDDEDEEGNNKNVSDEDKKKKEQDRDRRKRGGFDNHDFEKKPDQEGKPGKAGKPGKKLREINWDPIIQVAMNHAKQAGQSPAGLGREFDVYQRGFINWRSILSRIVSSYSQKSYCWTRPDKRLIPFDIYIPHVTGESTKVLFSIDTSGSISREELSKYFTEIISLAKSFDDVELRVLTHDVEVHDDYYVANGNIKKIEAIVPHGGGGTSHIPLYEYIEQKKYNKGNNILISMTDGYSSFPDKPTIETVFVLAGTYSVQSLPPWKKKVIELLS